MSTKDQTIIAFDLYGTLLSTDSIAKELSTHFGDEKATSLAALWRRYQLEYTWRLNSMNSGVSLDDNSIASLMKAYDSLSTFPDVPGALKDLDKESDITAVVFSNGTNSMVTNSVKSSPDLGPHASVFKDIVTVEKVQCFKPAPLVYYHLAKKMGKATTKEAMGEMWLVSGNPFDVVGARAVGMQAAWVDRAGNGWTDALVQGATGKPTLVVKGLGEVVDGVKKFVASK
ncbi:2-haloacid dehalogenase, partial [Lecanoromycetidae sp. Uapishka_2]